MEYYSTIRRSETESVEVMWMNLESVIQSEVSQKKKNKYCTLTHIYGILKNGTDEPVCRAGIEVLTYRMDLWTQQGKRRVRRIETVLTCVHYHV